MRLIQEIVRPPVLGKEFPDLTEFYAQLNANDQDLVGILTRMGIDVEPEDEPIIPKSDNHTAPASLVRAGSKNKDFHTAQVIAPITRISIDNFLVSIVDQAYQDGLLPDYIYYLCHLVWEAEVVESPDYQLWRLRMGPNRGAGRSSRMSSTRTEIIAQFLTAYQLYPRINELIMRFVNKLEYLFPTQKLLACRSIEERYEILVIGSAVDFQAAITLLTTGTSYTVTQHAAYYPARVAHHAKDAPFECHLFNEQGESFYPQEMYAWTGHEPEIVAFQAEVVRLYRLRKLRHLLPD